MREDVLAGLSLDEDSEQHLRELVAVLDATWKQMTERLEEAGADAKISIEVQPNGRAKLNVEKLHALGEPKSLKWLRERVEKMLPKIDLPDLLFEVHAWTGLLDAFVHLGDGRTRMKDLTTSVVALLVSEACNIGMTPVINPNYEALTRARLVHVDRYYLRADTIAAANAALIEAQAQVPIVKFWGNRLLASVGAERIPKGRRPAAALAWAHLLWLRSSRAASRGPRWAKRCGRHSRSGAGQGCDQRRFSAPLHHAGSPGTHSGLDLYRPSSNPVVPAVVLIPRTATVPPSGPATTGKR
nr:Tn3 family transposase [Streptomyces sp. ISL-44]